MHKTYRPNPDFNKKCLTFREKDALQVRCHTSVSHLRRFAESLLRQCWRTKLLGNRSVLFFLIGSSFEKQTPPKKDTCGLFYIRENNLFVRICWRNVKTIVNSGLGTVVCLHGKMNLLYQTRPKVLIITDKVKNKKRIFLLQV